MNKYVLVYQHTKDERYDFDAVYLYNMTLKTVERLCLGNDWTILFTTMGWTRQHSHCHTMKSLKSLKLRKYNFEILDVWRE